MVLDASGRVAAHARFTDLPALLRPGDLLVANRSRVLPARLAGRLPGGGRVELLLLRRREPGLWEALARPGRRLQAGRRVVLAGDVATCIDAHLGEGLRLVRFERGEEGERLALEHGSVPLPPYIRAWQGAPERYQTVYADRPGSAAAPTAGLHFTPSLFGRLQEAGIQLALITLHIGLDTFRPVKVDKLEAHPMHAEYYEVPADTLRAIVKARQECRRVIAVGTTVVRALESAAECIEQHLRSPDTSMSGVSGWTRLFIVPGYRFKLIDGLITNFHLPRSTLLMLVSALVGREHILAAYREAIERRYRFYSFGDAMLLWRVELSVSPTATFAEVRTS
jgi:S-adenosylmethionine:tRNA ribosyltransferase-isomerase